jgi:hypothetical protein
MRFHMFPTSFSFAYVMVCSVFANSSQVELH